MNFFVDIHTDEQKAENEGLQKEIERDVLEFSMFVLVILHDLYDEKWVFASECVCVC